MCDLEMTWEKCHHTFAVNCSIDNLRTVLDTEQFHQDRIAVLGKGKKKINGEFSDLPVGKLPTGALAPAAYLSR